MFSQGSQNPSQRTSEQGAESQTWLQYEEKSHHTASAFPGKFRKPTIMSDIIMRDFPYSLHFFFIHSAFLVQISMLDGMPLREVYCFMVRGIP